MKRKFIRVLVLVLLSAMLACSLTSCGDDYTAEDLYNAQKRRANGQKLNRQDSNMLKGFDKWKENKNKYDDY